MAYMPSAGFARLMPPARVHPAPLFEEAAQLYFQHARVDAFEDGDDAFQHHFAALLLLVNADAQLARRGQEEEIAAPTP
jgi:hypothetical protein